MAQLIHAKDSYSENKVEDDTILDGLNEKQKLAVTTFGCPLLILSSSGTGKTHTLTKKYIYAIERMGIHPNKIMAVTFTRKAAQELNTRITPILGINPKDTFIGTFHNISSRILKIHQSQHTGEHPFTLIDQDNKIQIMRNTFTSLGLNQSFEGPFLDKKIISLLKDLDTIKGNAIDLLQSDEEQPWNNLPRPSQENIQILKAYQSELKKNNNLDYNDLILDLVTLAKKNPIIAEGWARKFSLIMVDEYQDTNIAQEEWIKVFSPKGENLVCVGDDDQSIYGWRGAQTENILGFPARYKNAQTITLDINYRCPPNIIKYAMSVISENKIRHQKTISPSNADKKGEIYIHPLVNEKFSNHKILELIQSYKSENYKKITILTRINKQANDIAEFLHHNGIPIWRYNPDADSSPQLSLLTNWLRLLSNPSDNSATATFLEKAIGSDTTSLYWKAASLTDKTLLEYVQNAAEKNKISNDKIKQFISAYQELSFDSITLTNEEILDSILTKSGISKQIILLSEDAQNRFYKQFVAMRKIANNCALRDIVSHIQTEIADNTERPENTVAISTMHGMKGLESPIVITPDWTLGAFPSYQSGEIETEEARRLAFVTITRASKEIHILYNNAKGPSPFIKNK